jgi:hypothetical protein
MPDVAAGRPVKRYSDDEWLVRRDGSIFPIA